jgi:hypothetical protein
VTGRRRFLAGAFASLPAAALLPGLARADPPAALPQPPPGKALIVFFREWAWSGAVYSYPIREGKTVIGRLPVSTWFAVPVEPGWHTYSVFGRHDDMPIRTEAGQTYYVNCELGMGDGSYRSTLTPTQEWRFDAVAAKLGQVQPAKADKP